MTLPASFIDAGPQGADVYNLVSVPTQKYLPETFCFILSFNSCSVSGFFIHFSACFSSFWNISGFQDFVRVKQ